MKINTHKNTMKISKKNTMKINTQKNTMKINNISNSSLNENAKF